MTFETDKEITPVIFRKFSKKEGGEVIALFPTDLGTYDPYTCCSYMHVGQHGSTDPQGIINCTKVAKPDEYESLKRELESAPYGYRFKVYTRMQRDLFLKSRRAQLSAIK